MLTIESAPSNVIALRFTEVVGRADIEAMKMILRTKLQNRDRLGLLLDMSQCLALLPRRFWSRRGVSSRV